jgi:hypothetical protein
MLLSVGNSTIIRKWPIIYSQGPARLGFGLRMAGYDHACDESKYPSIPLSTPFVPYGPHDFR